MATIKTINGTDLISDSREDLNDNFSNLNSDKIETSVLDTDDTLAANSDTKIATQKAVKTYVDAGGNVNASSSTRGIVEIATSAEINAGTATGSTGASIVITPDQFKLTTNPIIRKYVSTDSPATWTKPAGIKYVLVELVAGGGGGGGADVAGGAAGGGGAGGYSRKIIAATSLGATETVTIGAGGAGGNSGATGATGGTTSFGSHLSATGGVGGEGNDNNVNNFKAGGDGGAGSDGDVNIDGGSGYACGTETDAGGHGGASFLGGGAKEVTGDATGVTAVVYGSGGGGAADSDGAGDGRVGGAGASGFVIVTEFYS